MLSDLSPLGDRFGGASDRWPNLQAHLITWPEDQPEPAPDDLPGIDLDGHHALPYPQSDPKRLEFAAVLTGGADCDAPQYRYRADHAGMLLLRWDFARFLGSPHEVKDPDELIGLVQRFKTLAADGARILDEVGLDIGLSERALTWKGYTRWLLALFETMEPGPQRIGCYEVRTIRDVWLASAQAIGRWLSTGREVASADECTSNEPGLNSEHHQDGPEAPNGFWWNNKQHKIPGNRWVMLKDLFEAPDRRLDERVLGAHIWGGEWDDSLLSTTINRLNNDLVSTPWRVKQEGKLVFLEQRPS